MFKKISEREQEVYDYIQERGELLVSNLPKNMMGVIPSLQNLGLVKTFRKPVTLWASKKQTYVKVI